MTVVVDIQGFQVEQCVADELHKQHTGSTQKGKAIMVMSTICVTVKHSAPHSG
jgi:hypothetical protein